MGRYRERDAQGEDDFSGLDELEQEENTREDHNGRMNFQGIEETLDMIREENQEDEQQLKQPERILPSEKIDFEAIRSRANHTYFLNSHDHIETPEHEELEIGISAHYEEMTDALMDYLQDDGIGALHQYVTGDLENADHWTNLVGLGVVEGEQNLSILGEYVTDQVFEYSD